MAPQDNVAAARILAPIARRGNPDVQAIMGYLYAIERENAACRTIILRLQFGIDVPRSRGIHGPNASWVCYRIKVRGSRVCHRSEN